MRALLNVLFVIAIGAVLTFAVAIRPNAVRRPSRWTLLVWFAVGIVVGLVFLSTYSLYAPQHA